VVQQQQRETETESNQPSQSFVDLGGRVHVGVVAWNKIFDELDNQHRNVNLHSADQLSDEEIDEQLMGKGQERKQVLGRRAKERKKANDRQEAYRTYMMNALDSMLAASLRAEKREEAFLRELERLNQTQPQTPPLMALWLQQQISNLPPPPRIIQQEVAATAAQVRRPPLKRAKTVPSFFPLCLQRE